MKKFQHSSTSMVVKAIAMAMSDYGIPVLIALAMTAVLMQA